MLFQALMTESSFQVRLHIRLILDLTTLLIAAAQDHRPANHEEHLVVAKVQVMEPSCTGWYVRIGALTIPVRTQWKGTSCDPSLGSVHSHPYG